MGESPTYFVPRTVFCKGSIEIRDRVVLRGEVKRCEDDLTHSYFLALKRFNPVLGNFLVFGVCVRVHALCRAGANCYIPARGSMYMQMYE